MSENKPSDPRGGALLELASRSIRTKLREPLSTYAGADGEPWLKEPGAVYVTLWVEGAIRGCLGSPLPTHPLGFTVWTMARMAAFQDFLFHPITEEELAGVSLEVSRISPLERLGWLPPAEVEAMLRPGVDGLIVQNDLHRGLFLPFMWKEHPTPAEFLAKIRGKAHLPEDFWGPEMRVWRFTVESFRE
jgi:AmmeMemoRadiSam system protein A